LNRIKGLTTIGTTDILGLATTTVFWFLLATLIDPGEYGTIFYFLSIAGIVSYVAPLGTNYVNTVFSAKRIKLIGELNLISVITTAIGSILLLIVTQRFDISLLVFGMVFYNLTIGKMLGEKKFNLYAITNLFQKSTTLIFGFIFFFLFGFENILYALALTYLLHIIIFFKELEIRKYNLSELKLKSHFILSNYSNNIVTMLSGQMDKLVIGILLGLTVLGNFSLAMQVITAMMILPSIITKYLITEDLYKIKNNDFKIKITIFSIILTALGIFLIPEIIPHILPKYLDVVEPIRIMSLAILPATYSRIQISKLLSQERGSIILGGSLVYVVILFVGIFSIGNSMGIIGLAISLVLSQISQVIAHSILNRKFPHND
jgi:O-antigen/teichoic acid export membrane protein